MPDRILTRENAKSLILTNTEKLKLPNDITVIGEGALAGFSQVKELTIHEYMHKVNAHAFYMRSFKNACGLERINIASSGTEFDPWAFYDCNALKAVSLPEDFSPQLAMELFFHTPGITLNFGKKLLFAAKSVTVAQLMEETSGILLFGAGGMLPVKDGVLEIPTTYYAIASHALRSLANKNVRKVVLHAGVRLIAPEVFADLPALEEVVLAEGTTHIDNAVFAHCKKLKTISIPESVKRIGAAAFFECESLTGIRLPSHLEALEDEVFGGCSSLVSLSLPEQITKVGAGAFADCTALRSMVLPDSVHSIGTSAFWNCAALQQLYIPPAAESIQTSALGNCNALTTLYMPHIIHDSLEMKRVFGETATIPDIQWITAEDPKPTFATMTAEDAVASLAAPEDIAEIAVPTSPVMPSRNTVSSVDGITAAPASEKAAEDAESVRRLEQTIADMQKKLDALSVQNPQTAQQPVLNADAIDALNANLTAIQEKFDSISGMQDSVAAISAMQEQVASIAAMQETVHERVGAISEIQEKMSEIDDIRARVDAIQPDAIGDMQQKVSAISDMRDKIDAISDIQQKVSAISDVQEKVSELSEMRQKIDAISDIQQKVDVISDVQEKVDAISDIQQKVSAIPDVQEKVDAIADIQQKVGVITDVQEKVGAISDVQEKVSEISSTQADISQRFAEMTGKHISPKENAAADEVLFDSAFVPVRRGKYRKDDKVFTYEISKPVEGPKQRSLMLKDFTVIAFRSFREKEGGERFEIPEGVRRVETQAFWNCPRLLALELPHSLNEVEPDAFSGCSRLTDVYLCEEFPERRAAEYFMFRPEIKLHWPKKSFLSKPKVLTVGELLEQYDDVLTAEKVKKLQVGNHVLQIPDGYSIIAPDMAKGINTRADEPEHILETIVLPKSLRRIGARAFSGLETVRHIVMSKGLQIIDMNAFTGCMGPYRLVLPNDVPYIGPYAFAAPCRFEQIRLPKHLTAIYENTFSNCDSLCSLRIPTSVQEIGDCALSGCMALTGLTLPKRFENDLRRILDGPVKSNIMWTEDMQDTFRNQPSAAFCDILEPSMEPLPSHRIFTKEAAAECSTFADRIALLRTRPYVGPLALSDMANQTKFEIPLGVVRLCSYAFGHNDRLLTLTIPRAIRTFEYASFYGLSMIRDVFLPDEFDRDSAAVLFMNYPQVLLNIGGSRAVRVRQVLHDCPWVLTANDISDFSVKDGVMTVPAGYMVIASYVYHGIAGMTHLHRLQLPPTARIIGYHAFAEQEHLEEVVCAEGLLAVEPHAFVNCHNLRRVVLPSTLRFLGSNPFMGCMRLETIVLPRSFADREEELRRDCPHLQIQWCEDFDDAARPSVIMDYSDIMQNARPAAAEMLTPYDEQDVPLHQEMDADYDAPIEASMLSEETLGQADESHMLDAATNAAPMLEDHAAKENTPDGVSVADTAEKVAALSVTEPNSVASGVGADIKDSTESAAETMEDEAALVAAAREGDNAASPEEPVDQPDDTAADALPDDPLSALADSLFASMNATDQQNAAQNKSDGDANAAPEMQADATEDEAVSAGASNTDDVPLAEEPKHTADAESDAVTSVNDTIDTVDDEAMAAVAAVLFQSDEDEAEKASAVSDEQENDTDAESVESAPCAVEITDDAAVEAVAANLFEDTSATDAVMDEAKEVKETQPDGTASDAELTGNATVAALAEALFAEPETGDATAAVDTAPSNVADNVTAAEPPAQIPADGRLTAKECRRIYKGEAEWIMPDGYREIRAGACAALEDLRVVSVSETVERIASGAFADCTALQIVVLPLSLQSIEDDAFEGCDAIAAVTAPETMQEQILAAFGENVTYTWTKEPPKIIGDGRFTAKIRNAMYHGEEELVIPEGYLEIRAGACAGLEELKTVILPKTLTRIASGAFADCIALESVTISASVTELADDAFEGCVALSHVTAPVHLESVIRTNFPNVLIELTENE
ncbi:MAG: leucine-rich repeat protein [Oscillospiraceae bacterium]|nr:leucine-rich repeat protein [Oscillospiraceae bacterium]